MDLQKTQQSLMDLQKAAVAGHGIMDLQKVPQPHHQQVVMDLQKLPGVSGVTGVNVHGVGVGVPGMSAPSIMDLQKVQTIGHGPIVLQAPTILTAPQTQVEHQHQQQQQHQPPQQPQQQPQQHQQQQPQQQPPPTSIGEALQLPLPPPIKAEPEVTLKVSQNVIKPEGEQQRGTMVPDRIKSRIKKVKLGVRQKTMFDHLVTFTKHKSPSGDPLDMITTLMTQLETFMDDVSDMLQSCCVKVADNKDGLPCISFSRRSLACKLISWVCS